MGPTRCQAIAGLDAGSSWRGAGSGWTGASSARALAHRQICPGERERGKGREGAGAEAGQVRATSNICT